MQITLDPIDWKRLTSFGSAEAFLEWYFDIEDEGELTPVSCYSFEWSDSAILYFQVASALEHLAAGGDEALAEQIRRGIGRLITENGHVDELGMSAASEGHYWISASPETTVELQRHIAALDRARLVALLKEKPAPYTEELMSDLDGLFVPLIEQHAKVVDAAVSGGYGLLGHCG